MTKKLQNMRIQLERSGGLAPAAMKRIVAIDSESLPADEAREFNLLVESAGIEEMTPPVPPSTPWPDAFGYTLTIEEGGRIQTIQFSEGNMAEPVRRLFNWLWKHAVSSEGSAQEP